MMPDAARHCGRRSAGLMCLAAALDLRGQSERAARITLGVLQSRILVRKGSLSVGTTRMLIGSIAV